MFFKRLLFELGVTIVLIFTILLVFTTKAKGLSYAKNPTKNSETKILKERDIDLKIGYNKEKITTQDGDFKAEIVIIPTNSNVKMITRAFNKDECLTNCIQESLNTILTSYPEASAGISGPEKMPIYDSEENKWIYAGKINDENISLIYQNGKAIKFELSTKNYKGRVYSAITGQTLINQNQIEVDEKKPLKTKRSGMGLNEEHIILVAAEDVSQLDLAKILLKTGAKNAIQLSEEYSSIWQIEKTAIDTETTPTAILFTY